MLRQLNNTVKQNPDYPMPEGFNKVKEKVPVLEYKVPESVLPVIGESKAVVIEVLDEMLSKAFNFHVLEPLVTI